MAFLKDDQGRFLFLNRYTEEVYGLRVAECTGKTASEIWPGEISAAIAESDRKVIESGTDIQEIEILSLEGGEATFFTQKFVVPLANGTRYIGGISLDITEYCRSEEKNRLLASAIQNSMESVFLLDGEGAIQYLNPAAEAALSVSRRDLVGTSYERYLSRTPDTGVPLSLKKVRFKPWRGVVERSRGEETKRELDVIIAPVSGSRGEIAHYIVIEHDVTEERLLQHALERKRRIEALGMLAGGIAHDFINILQPILINAELASESLPEGSPERELLGQIIEAARVGKDITSQIKMFGSRQRQVHKPVAIEPMMKNAMRIISQSLATGVELRKLIAPTSSLVRIAPAQFYQLLANLCINAMQAMDGAPGVLSVGLSEAEVSCPTPASVSLLTPGEYLKITVTDTGCGMCPEVLEHIFDPLFTTRKSGKGTGLGLGVVYAVLKNTGGSVVVSSRQDEGTTFEVYLPRHHAAPEETVEETAPEPLKPAGSRRGRVLLVDDNAPELKSIHRMLVRMGYRVASTSSSSKALHLFTNTPGDFDLLITDQIMQEMTGDQLVSRVLEIRSDLPAIICSGSEDALDELKGLPSSPAVFLSKPFSSSLLAEAIGEAFRKTTDICP
jgi:PAS domain S-box-containing protein